MAHSSSPQPQSIKTWVIKHQQHPRVAIQFMVFLSQISPSPPSCFQALNLMQLASALILSSIINSSLTIPPSWTCPIVYSLPLVLQNKSFSIQQTASTLWLWLETLIMQRSMISLGTTKNCLAHHPMGTYRWSRYPRRWVGWDLSWRMSQKKYAVNMR